MDFMMDSTTPVTATMTLTPMVSTTPYPETFIKLCLLWTALHRTASFPPACNGVIQDQNIMQIQSREDLGRLLNTLSNSNFNVGSGRDINIMMENMELEDEFNNHLKNQVRYTSRTLSVIGVLGGIVLILIIVAFTTCIRTRRNMLQREGETGNGSTGHEVFGRQILIDHIRNLSNSNRSNSDHPPPSYDDVVKDELSEEEEGEESEEDKHLPSYLEAVQHHQQLQQQHHQRPASALAAVHRSLASSSDNHVVTIEVAHGCLKEEESSSSTAATAASAR